MRTYLDGYGYGLELGWSIYLFHVIQTMYGRTKLIIDFFSMVPFKSGTASSGLALGRSAGTWFQIYALSTPLK
jgi:hypothetical protein